VYYCYQGVWYLKDNCAARGDSCVVEAPSIADTCSGGPSAACGAGDANLSDNGTCGPDNRLYYCYSNVWYLKQDCVAGGQSCHVNPPGVADQCQ
jgi:hypothetical protein